MVEKAIHDYLLKDRFASFQEFIQYSQKLDHKSVCQESWETNRLLVFVKHVEKKRGHVFV